MNHESLHGVTPGQEHRKEEFLRDLRPARVRLGSLVRRRTCFAGLVLGALFCELVWPATLLVLLPLTTGLFFLRRQLCRGERLPMRMPRDWNRPDPGDVQAKGSEHRARGAFYLGNDLEDNRELWIAREDVLTHLLILGTTGSGKTETLVSLAFNFLAAGSGLLYVDPKAAPKLAAQIYTMARLMGRDDDFLVLSYMADKQAQKSMRTLGHMRTPARQSNTQNPFADGTANQLTQLLFALMPEDSGSNAIFANNAQTLISGLMFVLVELRDKGEIPLSIGIIRKYLMSLPDIDALARRSDLSEKSILALRAGLATVGWDMSRQLHQQPKNFAEQYGYARAYFGRALSLLVDNYGRIFMTTHGEIDAVDVITSRRICVTLIPSMDKDPRELRNLGQICLSSIRNACAVGLGDSVQGRLADVLGALPTDARSPFGVVVDEYAAIETPGFEILLTQGRGLGIAVTVASQDFAGIRRASEHAAEQVVSNCKVKMFMCQEDPRQTFELIRAIAGEAWVQKSTGWSVANPARSLTYADNLAVSMEKMPRVDFRDLQKQVEGQMTIFFKGEMVRARSFYAAPPLNPWQEVRLAYHLKLQQPDRNSLSGFSTSYRQLVCFLDDLARGDWPAAGALSGDSTGALQGRQPEEAGEAGTAGEAEAAMDDLLESVLRVWEALEQDAGQTAGVPDRTDRADRAGWADGADSVHRLVAALLAALAEQAGAPAARKKDTGAALPAAWQGSGLQGEQEADARTGQAGGAGGLDIRGQDDRAGHVRPDLPDTPGTSGSPATLPIPAWLAEFAAEAEAADRDCYLPGPEDLMDCAACSSGAARTEILREVQAAEKARQAQAGREARQGAAPRDVVRGQDD